MPGLDTSFFVSDAIRQAVSLAAETMRPSVRKLAESLEAGPLSVNGWTFRRAKTGNRYDLAFVAENPFLPGGYLYNVRIRREWTDEAKKMRDEIQSRMLAHLEGVVDPDDWMTAFIEAQNARPPELVALEGDPSSYRKPLECRSEIMLAAWVFNDGRGMQPDTLGDDYSLSLDELLGGDLDGSNFVGRAFNARRSDELELSETNRHPVLQEAEVGTGRFAALEAMLLLDEAVTEAGLRGEIAARMAAFAGIEFRNYNSEGYEIPSLVAFGAVYRDGGRMSLGTVGTIVDLWEERTCRAIDRHAHSFVDLVRGLSRNGFVSADNQFDCHDLNDWAFVEETDELSGVVWLTTTGTRIAMAYELDEAAESLVALRIAEMASHQLDDGEPMVSSRLAETEMPEDAAEAGFIGAFSVTGNGYVADQMGMLSAFNFVALEKALGGFPAVAAALEEEYGNHIRPTA